MIKNTRVVLFVSIMLIVSSSGVGQEPNTNLINNRNLLENNLKWRSGSNTKLSGTKDSDGDILKFNMSGEASSFISSEYFNLKEKQAYCFDTYMKLLQFKPLVDRGHVAISVLFYDRNKKIIGCIYLPYLMTDFGLWQLLGRNFVTSHGTVKGKIKVNAFIPEKGQPLSVEGMLKAVHLSEKRQQIAGANVLRGGNFEIPGFHGWDISGANRSPVAHTGNHGVFLRKGCIKQVVQLKKNTSYLAKAFVKTDISNIGQDDAVFEIYKEPRGEESIVFRKSVSGKQDWQKLTGTFTTGNDDGEYIVCLAARSRQGGVNNVWFDDVSLAETPEPPKSVNNKIRNSSFEFNEFNADVPDTWYSDKAGLVEWQKNRYWEIDHTVAFDGAQSIRIRRPHDFKGPEELLSPTLYLGGKDKNSSIADFPDKDYCLSFWAKADRPDFKFKASIRWEAKELTANEQWQRFSCVFPTTKKGRKNFKWARGHDTNLYFIPCTEGCLWIDAIQLEEGGSPSEYTPSQYDKMKMTSSGSRPNDTQGSRRILSCVKTGVPPKIDGKLDDPCWASAAVIDDYSEFMKGGSVKFKSQGKLLFDDNYMYVGMCLSNDMENLRDSSIDRDQNIWAVSDDIVEIFLDPWRIGRIYQLAVDYNGNRWEGADCNPDAWNPACVIKTEKESDHWNLECAIPLCNLNMNGKGDWRINFCRWNSKIKEGSAWSTTFGSFLNEERYGVLKGIDKVARKRFHWKASGWKIIYSSIYPEKSMLMSVRISNLSNKTLKVRLASQEDEIQDNTIQKIPPKESIQVLLPLKIKTNNPDEKETVTEYAVSEFSIYDAEDNALLASFSKTLPVPQIFTITLNRSFYTSETKARLRIASSISPELINRLKSNTISEVQVTDTSHKIIFETELPLSGGTSYHDLSIEKFAPGKYQVDFYLKTDGKIIFQTDKPLQILPPAETEVKLNRFNQAALYNGKPFLPLVAAGMDWRKQEVRRLAKDLGFNCFIDQFDYRANSDEIARNIRDLDKLATDGFKLIVNGTNFPGFHNSKDTIEQYTLLWKLVIPSYRRHPAILAWNMIDEPACWSAPYGGNRNSLEALCKTGRDNDPYRPVYMNYSRKLSPAFGSDAADIASIDYYCDTKRYIGTYYDTCSKLLADSGGERPCWLWVHLQVGDFPIVELNPTQFTSTVYQSLIAGVRGIKYFIGLPTSKLLCDGLKDLNREIQTLAPILIEGETQSTEAIDVIPPTQDIRLLLKKYNDAYYLIAVNSSPKALDVRLVIPQDIRSHEALVMFENRKTPILKHGEINDQFKPYERHVYKIMEK